MPPQTRCRICLELKSCVTDINLEIIDAFQDIFLIEIQLKTQSSFQICMMCSQELVHFYKFYLKVKKNQVLYESQNFIDDTLPVFVKVETKLEQSSCDSDEFIPDIISETFEDDSTVEDNVAVSVKQIKGDTKSKDKAKVQNTAKSKFVKNKVKFKGDPIPEGVVLKDYKYPRGIKVCPICGKVRDRRNFTRHLKTHEHVRKKRPPITTPLICDICGFKTMRKPLLKSHMDIRHLRVRKSICEACGAAFARARDMQIHYRRHHQERQREQCNECGKYFIDVYAHWAHNHRKQGTFPCKICGRKFDNNRRLSGHISKSHRKIECTICKQVYKNNISLKEHMNQKHIQGEPLYSCNWCEFRGNYRKNLVAHLKKLHKKEYDTIRMKHETRHDQPEIPKRD